MRELRRDRNFYERVWRQLKKLRSDELVRMVRNLTFIGKRSRVATEAGPRNVKVTKGGTLEPPGKARGNYETTDYCD